MKNFKKGFTLIELLVVIALLSIVIAIVTVSLSSSQRKSTEAAYKSEVSSIQSKLSAICDSSGYSFIVAETDMPAEGKHGQGIINTNCQMNGYFNVLIPPRQNHAGACTGSVITNTEVSFAGC
ncbi:MAG TPA: type II secretion system protein [Candidatus Paceibacterota bacterium]|nr:type II secretion system protein [Candidatus Paceibacterota bacterium]HPT18231.1 type II secretion system protein [Candidatus Paceibacterota bacterium]